MPEKLIQGAIDGQSALAPQGEALLRAAARLGVHIPTLCHHEGLPPDGNCRLCLCETEGKLVCACMYPLRQDGFTVLTNSPRVREARAFVISLFLNRAPKAPRILKLAAEYGVSPDPRFAFDPDGCLRCGKCVRICQSQAGEAIALAGRGCGRVVTGPFRRPPEGCVGCLACAINCPAGCISFSDDGLKRAVWGREFELAPCPECGRRVFTQEQLTLLKAGDQLCPECRRRAMARELQKSEFIPDITRRVSVV
jgi:NADH dehydrogenase/NADH:ubiquinone oxidoreductase subunit G